MAKTIPKVGSRRNGRIGSRKNTRRIPKGVIHVQASFINIIPLFPKKKINYPQVLPKIS